MLEDLGFSNDISLLYGGLLQNQAKSTEFNKIPAQLESTVTNSRPSLLYST